MQLTQIPLANLAVSPANMRCGPKTPNIGDILPSVRSRGVLVPLLVRPNGTEGMYEIVAGRRRFHAALQVESEVGGLAALPCAVMEADDDASAIEASLIENLVRSNPDEVTQWEAFTQLVKAGRDASAIAATFDMTEQAVGRILALGNLLPAIRTLYRKDEIGAATVRHLTLASRQKQKEWLDLWRNPSERAPMGTSVKHWLFGGQSISASVAIFPLETYPGEIVSDLFDEDRYFADCEAFWTSQLAAVEERKAHYLSDGWVKVEVLEIGSPFHRWQHEKVGKSEGGAVYISVAHSGEVECHEGWLTSREAKRASGGEAPYERPARPELTAPLQNYLDLHRHAAARVALLSQPGLALRLLVTHAICGSSLWSVRQEPQTARSDAIAESVETSASETAFDEKRRAVLPLLSLDPEALTITRSARPSALPELFHRLLALSDDEVLSVAAIVMGETLEAGSAVVEAVGVHLAVDMTSVWQPDDAFYELLRDRRVVQALFGEVSSPAIAQANAGAALKVQKGIIRDCLSGNNGRPKIENWVPRWMKFPGDSYLRVEAS